MGRKINHPVHYEERLSLQPFMSEGQHGPTYTLYAVISHAGGGPNSGHYYAHVKSATGGWFEMNDDMVSRHGGAPTGMRNAYILFYIRDQHQALDAAIRTPLRSSVPPKPGVIAAMKKRKAPDSAEDDNRSSQTPSAPFIGPQIPPSLFSPTNSAPAIVQSPSAADPQAKLLKKKINAASQSKSAPTALGALAQYSDGDSPVDDIGETVPPNGTGDPPSSPTSRSVASSPITKLRKPAPIPASSFYGSSPPSANPKKRKSLDSDDAPSSKSSGEDWARTPLSVGMTFSSPLRKRPAFAKGGTPFSRLKGANNLHTNSTITQYGGKKKKRLIM